MKRKARIIGSRNALKSDFERVMEAMRAGDIPTEAIAFQSVALGDFSDRFAGLVRVSEQLVKVLVTP